LLAPPPAATAAVLTNSMDRDAQLAGTPTLEGKMSVERPDPYAGLEVSTRSGYDLCHRG